MKRLFLLRHAKAAPDEGGGDHERPLAERGRRDAPQIGREIARQGFLPDLILCSTARRTVETMDLVLPFLLPKPPVKLEPGLYHAEATVILSRVARLEDGVAAALFVGHNPGLEELAAHLAGDSRIGRQLGAGMPTCAFAAFTSDATSWRSAAEGTWTAGAYMRPADL